MKIITVVNEPYRVSSGRGHEGRDQIQKRVELQVTLSGRNRDQNNLMRVMS